MRRYFIRLMMGAALALLLPLPSPAPAGASPPLVGPYWQKIKDEGQLVIAIQDSYLPFAMADKKGELMGYDVEIARLLCRALAVKAVFKAMPLREAIPALQRGQADIALAAMTITPSRAMEVNFSHPYMVFSQGALIDKRFLPDLGVERDIEDVASRYSSYLDLARLPNLVIAVKDNSQPERLARIHFPQAKLLLVKDAQAAVQAVLKGDAKAMVHDAPFIKVWLAMNTSSRFRLHPMLSPVTQEGLGIAIRKGDLEFLRWLDTFVDFLQRSGDLNRLEQSYFEKLTWRSTLGQ